MRHFAAPFPTRDRAAAVQVIKLVVASVLMLGGSLLANRELGARASGRDRRLSLIALGAIMCWLAVRVSQA